MLPFLAIHSYGKKVSVTKRYKVAVLPPGHQFILGGNHSSPGSRVLLEGCPRSFLLLTVESWHRGSPSPHTVRSLVLVCFHHYEMGHLLDP